MILYGRIEEGVLYADDDIRIFTNRADSPDRWESEGLVVVQVRDELFA